MRLGAYADFGQAEPEGGFAEVDQRGRRDILLALVPESGPPLARRLESPGEKAVPGHFAQTAAQRQHADIHIGTPFRLDRQRHGRVLALERDHMRLDHSFAFDRDQSGREVRNGLRTWNLGDLAQACRSSLSRAARRPGHGPRRRTRSRPAWVTYTELAARLSRPSLSVALAMSST